MKFHMIVGKKQLVLASLILILGVAVYVNWTFAESEVNSLAANGSLIGDEITEENESDKNYGDAELVNGSMDAEKNLV